MSHHTIRIQQTLSNVYPEVLQENQHHVILICHNTVHAPFLLPEAMLQDHSRLPATTLKIVGPDMTACDLHRTS